MTEACGGGLVSMGFKGTNRGSDGYLNTNQHLTYLFKVAVSWAAEQFTSTKRDVLLH